MSEIWQHWLKDRDLTTLRDLIQVATSCGAVVELFDLNIGAEKLHLIAFYCESSGTNNTEIYYSEYLGNELLTLFYLTAKQMNRSNCVCKHIYLK